MIERAKARGKFTRDCAIGTIPIEVDVTDTEIAVNDGYGGFVAVLDFNDKGELERISAWE